VTQIRSDGAKAERQSAKWIHALKFENHITVSAAAILIDLLAVETGVSKTILKDCLNKGAVWFKRSGKKEQRVRKAKFTLLTNDRISIYYDDAILGCIVPEPECIVSEKQYSVWNKPPLLLSQGTRYGDHCSLLRLAEKNFAKIPEIHLVHRLDREASGLILLAHGKHSAGLFSELFRSGNIEKRYKAVIHGLLGNPGETFRYTAPLDGKSAETVVTVMKQDPLHNRTDIEVHLLTGRYHQIRRHLSDAGFPLVGDKRYGGKESENLQLRSYKLAFSCPFTGSRRSYNLDREIC
jgi:tRNA pseudouridine32 synthase/23S rRNA pseudouridine746 synthase